MTITTITLTGAEEVIEARAGAVATNVLGQDITTITMIGRTMMTLTSNETSSKHRDLYECQDPSARVSELWTPTSYSQDMGIIHIGYPTIFTFLK